MVEDNKLTFAPFVAAACVLWIAVTIMGGQGFTTVIGALAIASLFFARPSFKFPLYGWFLLAAFVWITITTYWSPAVGPIISGTLTGEDFAVDIASVRLGGVALFAALAIGASQKAPNGKTNKSAATILIAGAVLFALLIIAYIMQNAILDAAYSGDADKALKEGQQNFQRATVYVVSFLAFALPFAWQRCRGAIVRGVLILMVLATMIISQLFGSQSAIVSLLLMGLGYLLVYLKVFSSIRPMMRLMAAYVLFAPLLYLGGIQVVNRAGLSLPESFQARIYAWRETLNQIFEEPILGHGIEASGGWKQTYTAQPEWLEQLVGLAATGQEEIMRNAWSNYPIVPGHPHSMPLEIWADTGAIGAVLVALTLWLAGQRMARSNPSHRATTYAAIGIIASALPVISFGYSTWNEAYWGMIAISVCALIILDKRAAHEP